jgi:hypothetical protein
VFRRQKQRLRERGSVTPTALVNAGRPRTVRTPANEDAITAAVEREPWKSSRDIARELGLSQQRGLEVLHDDQLHSYHYSPGAHVSRRSSSTDAILRTATKSTRCGWGLFTQHSVDRRNVFYAWGCAQRLQRSPLGTG